MMLLRLSPLLHEIILYRGLFLYFSIISLFVACGKRVCLWKGCFRKQAKVLLKGYYWRHLMAMVVKKAVTLQSDIILLIVNIDAIINIKLLR